MEEEPEMRLIGLTGGIGSGKSKVTAVLRHLGASVVDADALTHQIQGRGQPGWETIRDAYGWSILSPDGEIQRKKLGFLIFRDPKQRIRLNEMIHPLVRQEMAKAIDRNRDQGIGITILDVPLLIEGGMYREVDEVWVVYTDLETQVKRIAQRDGIGREEALKRVTSQMPLEEKIRYAHRVIQNTGTVEQLKEEVQALWHEVTGFA